MGRYLHCQWPIIAQPTSIGVLSSSCICYRTLLLPWSRCNAVNETSTSDGIAWLRRGCDRLANYRDSTPPWWIQVTTVCSSPSSIAKHLMAAWQTHLIPRWWLTLFCWSHSIVQMTRLNAPTSLTAEATFLLTHFDDLTGFNNEGLFFISTPWYWWHHNGNPAWCLQNGIDGRQHRLKFISTTIQLVSWGGLNAKDLCLPSRRLSAH